MMRRFVGGPLSSKQPSPLQASGEAVYSSDVGVGAQRQLYASVVASDRALAAVDSIDPAAALEVGVLLQQGRRASICVGSAKNVASYMLGFQIFIESSPSYETTLSRL